MFEIIFLIAGLVVGGGAVWMMHRASVSASVARERELKDLASGIENRLREEQERAASIQHENVSLQKEAAVSAADKRALEERLSTQKQEIEEIRTQSRIEFENIANRILEEKSKKFTESNRESISNILKPLDENLEKFRKKVEEVYDRESKERFSLGREVEKLVQANQRISEQANNLANALKGNSKTQGNWGEMILENILERSGLTKGREYVVQESLRDESDNTLLNEEGRRMIPDVIVNYPDERKVIIDSKVSLTDYIRYAECDNETECKSYLEKHTASIRRHIDELSRKSYQEYTSTLDFVMMFIPNEAAYMAAMSCDPELWNYAYGKKILLISPTNLITSLKLIADLWSREYQNRNAMEIADRGAQLYDKFAGFVHSMKRIGDNITKTDEAYTDAMKQLSEGRGNLIGQVEKLRKLGIKTRKTLSASQTDEDETDEE